VDGEILAAHGVCGLFVNGREAVEKKLSKELAGYVEEGPTHCGNCEYYTGGKKQSGACRKVGGLVEFHGCCNQWEERDEDDEPKSEAEKSGMRG
jgi:hypothetical protein